jgi:hypothetical protein
MNSSSEFMRIRTPQEQRWLALLAITLFLGYLDGIVLQK